MPERKISYQVLDHKADTGFMVTAPSYERLYIDSALALTDMLVKLEQIKDVDKKNIEVSAENKEQLMVKWLNEVLMLLDKDEFLTKRVVFEKFDGKKIKAALWGEKLDPIRHGSFSEVKAVTYHQLEFGEARSGEGFYVRVFLDL